MVTSSRTGTPAGLSGAAMRDHPFRAQWNHNTHYFPEIAAAVGHAARHVCDVGCGDGTLARYLARPGRVVTGIDLDERVLPADSELADLSREGTATGLVRFLVGSADHLPLPDASQDAVTMSMVLHHLDHGPDPDGSATALRECARVLRPAGVLVVLGYARSAGLGDLWHELRDALTHRRLARHTTRYEPDVSVRDPVLTWEATASLFARELPGSTLQRVPLWRYMATWVRPSTDVSAGG